MSYKKLKIDKDSKMSDIILNNHLMILVMERFGIGLGVHNKTVKVICDDNNISIEVFLTIANLQNDISYITDSPFIGTDIYEIIQYLRNAHDYYSEEVFPEIVKNIHLLSEYSKEPEFLMVEQFFTDYRKEVEQHFDYENITAFPYIISLIKDKNQTLDFSIKEYKEHHDDIEEKLFDLRKLLIQHLPSRNDLKIRRKILIELAYLEDDLNVHAKIENEIVIPLVENIEMSTKK